MAVKDEEPWDADECQNDGENNLNSGAAKGDKRRYQQRVAKRLENLSKGLKLIAIEVGESATEPILSAVTDLKTCNSEGGELVPV